MIDFYVIFFLDLISCFIPRVLEKFSSFPHPNVPSVESSPDFEEEPAP